MEYIIRRNIDGKEIEVEVNSEECNDIFREVEKEYQRHDVLDNYADYTLKYNVVEEIKEDIISDVLLKYNKKYGDSENGSWKDCLDYAYNEVLGVQNRRAIIEFRDNGKPSFFYGHFSGLESSVPIRCNQCLENAKSNKTSLYKELLELSQNGKKMFTEISPDSAFEILGSFPDKNNIYTAIITVDTEKNNYTYKSLFGHISYSVKLDDILKLAQSIGNKPVFQTEREFGEKRDILLNEHYTKSVLVEPGLRSTTYYFNSDLYGLQHAVHGYIETMPQIDDKGVVAFGNEEARIYEMSPNRKFGDNLLNAICGPFVILGDDNGEIISLTDEQERKYLYQFKEPDVFTEKEKYEALNIRFEFIDFGPIDSEPAAGKKSGGIKL